MCASPLPSVRSRRGSPRTYNNYFSSREQAIVAAVTAERASRVASAVAARAADVSLADAVIDAVVGQYTEPGDNARDALLMITTSPALDAAANRARHGRRASLHTHWDFVIVTGSSISMTSARRPTR
jgi:hypothetical protein